MQNLCDHIAKRKKTEKYAWDGQYYPNKAQTTFNYITIYQIFGNTRRICNILHQFRQFVFVELQ